MAKISSKGQVAIPSHLRKAYGLEAGVEVQFVAEPEALYIVKKPATRKVETQIQALEAWLSDDTIPTSKVSEEQLEIWKKERLQRYD